jgi:diacylglycerol kinase (ATP)
MSATAVLNAHARRLRRPVFAARVESALHRTLPAPTVLRPACADAARDAIAQAPAGLLVVAGGDGAVNLALNALPASAPHLGIIPGGTANDLARALELPLDPEGAAARLTAPARPVDVLTVNGRRFLTTGGIGLPALVARVANRVKRRGGRLARLFGDRLYALVAASQILGRRRLGQPVRIGWICPQTGVERHLAVRAYGALVTNVGAVAGRMRLCASTIDDGVFEICVLPARGRLRLLDTLLRLSAGKAVSSRRMPVIRARTAWIEGAADAFFGDGETLAEGGRFEIGLEAHGVHIAGA